MDYHSRYGLEYNPFIKNAKIDKLIETIEYKECITRLNTLLITKGFGLIVGDPGRGKTSTIRQWSKTLNKSLYNVIYISFSTITVNQFYQQLAQELGLEPDAKKTTNYKNIKELIRNLAFEKKKTPVIILDEANYISTSILNDLKMLFNFEMDSRDHAVVILVGLPNIINTLKGKTQEPLRQRIIMNYHIDGINKTDAKKYIVEKLKAAGCMHDVFDENGIEAIISGGNGTLRLINNICNNSLLIGNLNNKELIDSEIVMSAKNELEM